MKQFANYISLTPTYHVSNIINNQVIMKPGYEIDKFITSNEVDPEETLDESSAGNLWKFELTISVPKLTDSQKRIYANKVPIILQLYDSDTFEPVIVGMLKTPANVSFISNANYDQLKIQYISKVPVL